MANFFNVYGKAGYFGGSVLLQDKAEIGGARSVFVDLTGIKNQLELPTFGGIIQNPFKTSEPAKFFAGDLFELRFDDNGENPLLFLLKTFKVKSQETTTVVIYRDNYSHVPCVGDILMKAPSTMSTKGKGYKVLSVTPGEGTWTLTFETALDTVTDGDILVEAKEEGASVNMLLQTVNCVAPSDGNSAYSPASNATTETSDARYLYTPVLHGTMYIHKMSPLPACVKALNKSRFNGWFEV